MKTWKLPITKLLAAMLVLALCGAPELAQAMSEPQIETNTQTPPGRSPQAQQPAPNNPPNGATSDPSRGPQTPPPRANPLPTAPRAQQPAQHTPAATPT